jgi:aryl-alcohol dehydrogenase-like predicted oxidoreductase
VISSPIIGANSTQQLNDSISATGIILTDQEMTALDQASKG